MLLNEINIDDYEQLEEPEDFDEDEYYREDPRPSPWEDEEIDWQTATNNYEAQFDRR